MSVFQKTQPSDLNNETWHQLTENINKYKSKTQEDIPICNIPKKCEWKWTTHLSAILIFVHIEEGGDSVVINSGTG